jgi:hypothetical protein
MPEWGRLNRGTPNSYPTRVGPNPGSGENFTFLEPTSALWTCDLGAT